MLFQWKHRPSSQPPSPKIVYKRHYYTDAKRFEQSLDVYDTTPSSSLSHHNAQQQPLVVLVVGSAWMGHYWWIYRLTSWWNSACPRTILEATNTQCIAIRHRGRWLANGPVLHGLVATAWTSCCSWIGVKWKQRQNNSNTNTPLLGLGALVALLLYSTYSIYYHPVPSIPDMVEDVETALQWIQRQYPQRSIVFGGYSSGGHIAALTLSNNIVVGDTNTNKSTTLPHIQAVLYISPVLAVQQSQQSSSSFCLTDLIMYLIWGSQWRQCVPSPLLQQETTLPHQHRPYLMIGCRHEVPLGITWLDTFLCGAAYYQKQLHIPSSTYRTIHSANHWTVLASPELRNVIREEWMRNEEAGGILVTPHAR